VPVHTGLHGDLKLWIDDERGDWRGADTDPALLLNHRDGRLSTRGARDILAAIARGRRPRPGRRGISERRTARSRPSPGFGLSVRISQAAVPFANHWNA
jgi:hypothetical protein